MGFRLTIDQFKLEIDPVKIPYGETGQAGSILDLALGHDIRINHTCGGVCSCTTCHVLVTRGLETCTPASAAERNRLEEVLGRRDNSRLACQCIPGGSEDIEVEIP